MRRTQGLLFIPDISGFTRFVSEMEIDHSRMIIAELIAVLIDASTIGLEVSEVEGDAVLFYRFGAPPGVQELSGQVEHMFKAFHERLLDFDATRLCQCQACVTACDLTLKIVSHYGEFTAYNVKQFTKLHGRDVIVAHYLLKNDIDFHEYWLVTEQLLHEDANVELPGWIRWTRGVKRLEGKELPFRFTPLHELRGCLQAVTVPDPAAIDPPATIVAASRDYDGDLSFLFHAVTNLDYRSRWQEGVRGVEYRRDVLPRVGTVSVRIRDSGSTTMCTSGYLHERNRIVFSETEVDRPGTYVFTGEQVSSGCARLTIAYHLRSNLVSERPVSAAAARSIRIDLQRSLSSLERLLTELKLLARR